MWGVRVKEDPVCWILALWQGGFPHCQVKCEGCRGLPAHLAQGKAREAGKGERSPGRMPRGRARSDPAIVARAGGGRLSQSENHHLLLLCEQKKNAKFCSQAVKVLHASLTHFLQRLEATLRRTTGWSPPPVYTTDRAVCQGGLPWQYCTNQVRAHPQVAKWRIHRLAGIWLS